MTNLVVCFRVLHGAIDDVLDVEAWDEELKKENAHKKALAAVSDKWPKVAKFAMKKTKKRKPAKRKKK